MTYIVHGSPTAVRTSDGELHTLNPDDGRKNFQVVVNAHSPEYASFLAMKHWVREGYLLSITLIEPQEETS